jgi:hypothetical protein
MLAEICCWISQKKTDDYERFQKRNQRVRIAAHTRFTECLATHAGWKRGGKARIPLTNRLARHFLRYAFGLALKPGLEHEQPPEP